MLKHPLDKGRRTIIIHSKLALPNQLETYMNYMMHPSFFTNHAYFYGDVYSENSGEKHAQCMGPILGVNLLGLKPKNHSDDTATLVNSIFSGCSAVNRVSRWGAIIGKNEGGISYQALQSITSKAANEYFCRTI